MGLGLVDCSYLSVGSLHQHETLASCPDWAQTIIFKNIRETIKAKMAKKHRIGEDHKEGFSDDWAAVTAKVLNQPSSQPHMGLYGFRVSCRIGHPMWYSTDSQSNFQQPAYWNTGRRR